MRPGNEFIRQRAEREIVEMHVSTFDGNRVSPPRRARTSDEIAPFGHESAPVLQVNLRSRKVSRTFRSPGAEEIVKDHA